MAKKSRGAHSPRSADLSQLSIRDLLGCLKPGQVWAILTALALIAVGAFMAGIKVEGLRASGMPGETSIDPITATAPQNMFQLEIRKRPAVLAWERFLNAVAAEQWDKAWEYLGTEWRERIVSWMNLAYEYRRTKSSQFHYYMPIRITDREERYLVDYEFEDILQVLPVRDSIVKSPLSVALRPDLYDALIEEYSGALCEAFVNPATDSTALRAVQEAASSWTVRDLVLNDSLIERLGMVLGWKPIIPFGLTGTGGRPATSERRLVEVVIVKEEPSGGWKLKSYDSHTIGPR